jgi:T4 RnlA family RNA ligase
MLKVQKFLKARPLEDLRQDPFNLHISAKGNLILLKYNQFNSDFTHSLVKESRGIILEKGTWKIVCHPFHKFFNLGESYAFNIIDLKESHIFEKVDGSIIKVYHYDDEWHIATNGTIDADDASNNDGISFKKLFFDVISKVEFNKLTENFDKENTYLFELIHPATQIVVDYENRKELVLLGIIKNEVVDGEVIDYDILDIRKKMEKIFKDLSIRYPRVFKLDNVNDVAELSAIADDENVNGNDFEGFVVTQVKDGNVVGRVKIKSPKYVNLHHVATGDGVTNNLIDVLMKNEMEEFEVYLEKLPESVAEEYKLLKKKYFELVEYLSEEGAKYRKKSNEMTRKELAMDIQRFVKKNCTGFIFKMVDKPEVTPIELIKIFGLKKVKALLT